MPIIGGMLSGKGWEVEDQHKEDEIGYSLTVECGA